MSTNLCHDLRISENIYSLITYNDIYKFIKHVLVDNSSDLATTLTNNRDVDRAKTNCQFHKFRDANFKGFDTRSHDPDLQKKNSQ